MLNRYGKQPLHALSSILTSAVAIFFGPRPTESHSALKFVAAAILKIFADVGDFVSPISHWLTAALDTPQARARAPWLRPACSRAYFIRSETLFMVSNLSIPDG